MKVLRAYADAQVPTTTESVVVELGSEPACAVKLSNGSDMQLISEWALPCLFRVLSAKDILSFFHAALVEKNVIIVSQNPGLLSGIV